MKARTNHTEMSQEKRAFLEEAVKRKKECEHKALKIVEHLVENLAVSPLWLTLNAQFLNPSYYQDATEERSILSWCGFPICPNQIKKGSKQQYSIDMKSKKVYDLTFRKNFCSDSCYLASSDFKNQLLTSPLWMRKKEKIPQFSINHTNRGLRGDVVPVSSTVLPPADDSNANDVEIIESVRTRTRTDKQNHLLPLSNPKEVVYRTFQNWLTNETYNWLRKIDHDVISIPQVMANKRALAPEVECSNRLLHSRLLAFHSSQPEYSIDDDQSKQHFEIDPKNTIDKTVSFVMPMTNSSVQKVLRRKIVMNYVEKWFPQLKVLTGLEFRNYQRNLNELVSTFNLAADNVTFRPQEVPLMSFLLVLLLHMKETTVFSPNVKTCSGLLGFTANYGTTVDELQEFLHEILKKFERV